MLTVPATAVSAKVTARMTSAKSSKMTHRTAAGEVAW